MKKGKENQSDKLFHNIINANSVAKTIIESKN